MQLSFHRNLGNIDRIIRVLVGIVLLDLVFLGYPLVMSTWLSVLLGIFGLAMIVEGVLAY
jgi:hypothetical protein